MPTVLVLDVSLSMCRPVNTPDSTEPFQVRNLAIHGINTLLDHLNQHCKLEFSSLVIFSSLWELVVPFTRDFELLKSGLLKVECHDRTNLQIGLEGARQVVLDEWGSSMPCQVILITDGSLGVGSASLHKAHGSLSANEDSFPLPLPFQSKLHVVCLANPGSPTLKTSLPFYQRLVDLNGGGGQVFSPEGPLTLKNVQQLFLSLAETYYASFHGVLRCGNLSSNVILCPPPEPFHKAGDFEWTTAAMSESIEICGFLDIADVANPPTLSRHLVLPVALHKPTVEEDSTSTVKIEAEEEDGANDEGKQPSFCVLLHGSLKVEGMVAICQLASNWYGMLYSWADSKKKSNLMLSTFEPGMQTVPWLGKFSQLGSCSGTEAASLPVKPVYKHSYSQNSVVWIRQSDLQADIQKILRHARKLPEKTANFYKELNRLRRAALSLGFHELLEGMATILERECTLLPGSAHPDAALQLTHASSFLRGPACSDYSVPLVPLRTKFTTNE
ncbi:integrator complex subunit 14-like [Ornithodoros turicata]|uniref:Integrator complex subunit 14 n=1 Tax=Ornithodoros turicata TaxID=34597 RepID=A0A2R5LFF7_9ACAR